MTTKLRVGAMIATAAVCFLSTAASAAQSDTEKVHGLLNAAMNAQRRGDTMTAYASYDNALAAVAGDTVLSANILFRRTWLSYQRGDSATAERGFDQLYRDYPKSSQAARAAVLTAQLKLQRGAITEALPLFEQVKAKTAQETGSTTAAALSAAATFGIACCKEHGGASNEARKLYQEVVDKWPHTVEGVLSQRRLKKP